MLYTNLFMVDCEAQMEAISFWTRIEIRKQLDYPYMLSGRGSNPRPHRENGLPLGQCCVFMASKHSIYNLNSPLSDSDSISYRGVNLIFLKSLTKSQYYSAMSMAETEVTEHSVFNWEKGNPSGSTVCMKKLAASSLLKYVPDISYATGGHL